MSATQALALFDQDPPAVVMSDLRMPEQDGLALIGRIHERWPDTVSILLTGQLDLEAAIAAVNEARVFRLLVKPCRPAVLLGALAAACQEHRRLVAARSHLPLASQATGGRP
jgi:DNA-binding NtrC family response regulator